MLQSLLWRYRCMLHSKHQINMHFYTQDNLWCISVWQHFISISLLLLALSTTYKLRVAGTVHTYTMALKKVHNKKSQRLSGDERLDCCNLGTMWKQSFIIYKRHVRCLLQKWHKWWPDFLCRNKLLNPFQFLRTIMLCFCDNNDVDAFQCNSKSHFAG